MTDTSLDTRPAARKRPRQPAQLALLPAPGSASLTLPDVPATFHAFVRGRSRGAWSAREVPDHLFDDAFPGGARAGGPEAPPAVFSSSSLADLDDAASAASGAPARYGPLGKHVNNSVGPGKVGWTRVNDPELLARRDRLALRSVVRNISRLKSKPQENPRSGKKNESVYTLRRCGLVPQPRTRKKGTAPSPSGYVSLRVGRAESGTRFGYAEGLVHCGSITSCPVCGASIRSGRMVIYAASASRWVEAGNTILMVTLTFPHYEGMALAPMWDMVSKGASHLTSSQAWRVLRASFGKQMWYRRALEQTFGLNGWHPHCHMLLYIRGKVSKARMEDIEGYFRAEWQTWVVRNGYGKPSEEYGVNVTRCKRGCEAGEYIVKTQDGHQVGRELTRGDLKRGKDSWTPFDILRAYRQAEDPAERQALKELWWEYEAAAKGRRIITQSRDLKKVLGEEDPTDQELAQKEVEDHEEIGEITPAAWRQVCNRGLEAIVFEALVAGGLARVNEILGQVGIDLAYPPLGAMTGGP